MKNKKYIKMAFLIALIIFTTSNYSSALESETILQESADGKYVFVTGEGEIVSSVYDYVYSLNDNLYVIIKEGSQGRSIYNTLTNTASEYIYTNISNSSDGNFVSFKTLDFKSGLLDENGDILLEATLNNLSEKKNVYLCFNGDKLAIYNKKNRSMGQFKYDTFDGFFSIDKRELAIVEIDFKYGVIDDNDNLIAPIIYDYIEAFKYRHAVVYKNTTCGVIDKNGKQVIDNIYDDIELSSEYIWTAKQDGKYGYINSKGKIIVDIKFESAEPFTSFKNAIIETKGKKGVIGLTGQYIVNPIYEDIISTDENLFIVQDYESKKYGVIDIDSNIIIDLKYDSIGKFSEDSFGTITLDDTYALINYKGEIITEFKKTENKTPPVSINYNTIESFMSIDSFLKGLRDINEIVVVEPMYDWISKTKDGLFLVTKDSKDGIINSAGEIIIPIVYEELTGFHPENALAKIDGEYRLISKDNKIVSDFSCDEFFTASYDYDSKTFVFMKDSKYGVADFDGNILYEPTSEKIFPLSDEFVAYEVDGLFGVMNFEKKIILDARYDSIYKKYNSYVVTIQGFYHVVDLAGNAVSAFYDGFLPMTDKLYRFTTDNDGLYGLYNIETQKEVLSEMYPTMYTLENKYNYKKSTVKIAFKTDDPQRISKIGLLNTDGSIAIIPDDYEFYFKGEDLIKYYDYDYKAGLYSMTTKKKLDSIYDSIGNFDDNDIAIIGLDSKYALINKDLDIITPFIFDHIGKFENGYADIHKGSKRGRINIRGEYTLE